MTPQPQPQIPGMDQVQGELQSLPTVTGRPEQFIGPAGSGPPAITQNPQYSGLEIQQRTVACTNFNAFDHSQLVANVEPMQSAAVGAFRQEWATAANTVADTFETFASTIGRAISEKWQGASGEAASTAIVGYARNSVQLADASNLLARQVGLLADSLDQTKTTLPGEPAATFPGKIAGFFGADGWDDERREAAKQQAVKVLSGVYYGNGISPTASGVPVFPAVQSPISGSPEMPSLGTGGGSPSGSGAPGGSAGSSPTGPTGAPQSDTPAGDVPGAATTDPAAAQGLAESPGGQGLPGNAPTQTVAASAQPGGIPGAGAGGLGGGGSSGGLSAGGVGGGAGAGGLTAAPPGGGVVAGPGGAGGMRPAAAAAGRAGMGGMGMAPMGGARGGGRGEGDNEHKTPDYLQNDELRQWIDEQADRGYAPVIGAPRPAPGDGNGGSGQQ